MKHIKIIRWLGICLMCFGLLISFMGLITQGSNGVAIAFLVMFFIYIPGILIVMISNEMKHRKTENGTVS